MPRAYLDRTAFWDRLDAARSSAVTIVVAPAGAGKTMGVAGWLRHRDVGERAIWLDAGQGVDLDCLEHALTDASGPAGQSARTIVIDDAHALPGRCLREIGARLNAEPDSMRLLLLARWDLPISRLVPELLGHLTVIRGDALRLSDAEALSLIEIQAPSPAPEVRQVIVDRAQGWCAAVVLAARAGALAKDDAEFVHMFRSSSVEVIGLVAQEVFAGLRPRERHLLLCTAMDGVVTVETARELTNDPGVDEVLTSLETTGFLVHRVTEGYAAEGAVSSTTRFHLHPLIVEVARRRLAAGGVDVEVARSTVLRAVRLQLGQGDVAAGLRRLLLLGEYDAATDIVVAHGPRVLDIDGGRLLDDLVTRGAGAVEGHPQAWAVIACAMRRRGERASAVHWAERVLAHAAKHPAVITPHQSALAELLLARLGAQSPMPALGHARTVVADLATSSAHDSVLPLVLMELGVVENWVGELEHAEEHLSQAVLGFDSEQLGSLAHEAMSHLALTEFMAAREVAAHDLADRVLAAVTSEHTTDSPVVRRAAMVRALVRLQARPWSEADEVWAPGDSVSVDDPAGRFWQQVLQTRIAVLEGSIVSAQAFLRRSPESIRLPQHLKRSLVVEQSRLSILTLDQEHLRAAGQELADDGAAGESLWVSAAVADLQGDVRLAAELFEAASRSVTVEQPAVRETTLVCAAQLYHYRGDHERARALLEQALVRSEHRQDATPFLGWTTHGTPVGTMLRDLQRTATAWTREITGACSDHPGIAAATRPLVATAQELNTVEDLVVAASLSPREKEVLGELARGATYADIARNLFVSENTVKTHVSNVYVKLSAKRRSEALAAARKLHLL